ncbi:hypothetical protein J6590_072790 [Homalodisca vitripennis]|nr:hypothetical protein J6590_072790 [Homalodisca vitripennis]
MNNRIDIDDPRPYTNVDIYGRNFKALIDTGAVASLINEEIADFLGKPTILKCPSGAYIALNAESPITIWT